MSLCEGFVANNTALSYKQPKNPSVNGLVYQPDTCRNMQFYLWFGYAFMLLSATVLIFVGLWFWVNKCIREQEKTIKETKVIQRGSDASENEDEIIASNRAA